MCKPLMYNIRFRFSISTGTPSVTSLQVVDSANSSIFSLNCTSTDSPATAVTWTKDGEVLSDDPTYQVLRDGSMSTQDSIITIDATPEELVGTYSCSVLNSAGMSNVESATFRGANASITVKPPSIYPRGAHNKKSP